MLVVVIEEPRAADESMRTYITDDGESGDWLVQDLRHLLAL